MIRVFKMKPGVEKEGKERPRVLKMYRTCPPRLQHEGGVFENRRLGALANPSQFCLNLVLVAF